MPRLMYYEATRGFIIKRLGCRECLNCGRQVYGAINDAKNTMREIRLSISPRDFNVGEE